jgi:hypothetical protein
MKDKRTKESLAVLSWHPGQLQRLVDRRHSLVDLVLWHLHVWLLGVQDKLDSQQLQALGEATFEPGLLGLGSTPKKSSKAANASVAMAAEPSATYIPKSPMKHVTKL